MLWHGTFLKAFLLLLATGTLASSSAAAPPDLILHHGKIVTVDAKFSIAEAIAIEGDRIAAVGTNEAVMKLRGKETRLVDLAGRMVLPGLIDSHTHPSGASMHEFDHAKPDMETIGDVLDYIASRTKAVDEGNWIYVNQVFITRLRKQRYPTRTELDRVAPKHPVVFSTGPDASLNSLALKLSGIDKDFKLVGTGRIERDPQTGEPNGILRSCKRYIKGGPSGEKKATEKDRTERLVKLFKDYNSVGLTCISDRSAGGSSVERYYRLERAGKLTVRIAASRSFSASGSQKDLRRRAQEIADHPLAKSRGMVRIIGTKIFLDGGMLTGSAYMRKPWGVSKIYSITDPRYRGVRFVEQEQLVKAVRAVAGAGLQFTAHSVGDGAVHALLDAYEEVGKTLPIRKTRPCITHCNFMSREAIDRMAALGIVADIQPAWLYLDARTLSAQFGNERLRYFQPLSSLFKSGVVIGGGSDHMQKIGSLRSINPYNPFLAMWVTLTRRARWYEGQLHPEEALSREQAIRFYTSNNAYLLFREQEIGSLEAGKQADLVVLDTDLLACPVEKVKDTKVLRTYLGGRLMFGRD